MEVTFKRAHNGGVIAFICGIPAFPDRYENRGLKARPGETWEVEIWHTVRDIHFLRLIHRVESGHKPLPSGITPLWLDSIPEPALQCGHLQSDSFYAPWLEGEDTMDQHDAVTYDELSEGSELEELDRLYDRRRGGHETFTWLGLNLDMCPKPKKKHRKVYHGILA